MRGLISTLVVLPFLAGCVASSYGVSGHSHGGSLRSRVVVTAPPPVVVRRKVVVTPSPVIVQKRVVVTPPPVIRKRVVVVPPPRVVHKKKVVVRTSPDVTKKWVVIRRKPVHREKVVVGQPGTVVPPRYRKEPETRRHPVEIARKEDRHHRRNDNHHAHRERQQVVFRQLELYPEGSMRHDGHRVKVTGKRVIVKPGQTTRIVLRAGRRTLPVWVRCRDNRLEFARSETFRRGRVVHTVLPSWKVGGQLQLRFDGADIRMRVKMAG